MKRNHSAFVVFVLASFIVSHVLFAPLCGATAHAFYGEPYSVSGAWDSVPGAFPANMIQEPTKTNQYVWNGDWTKSFPDGNSETHESVLLIKRDTAKTIGGIWNPAGMHVNEKKMNGTFAARKNYVFSARVKNYASELTPSVKFAAMLGLYNGVDTKTQTLTGGDWQNFKTVFSLERVPSSGAIIQFGLPATETQENAQIAVDLAEGFAPYVAEEVLYDITNGCVSGTPLFQSGVGGSLTAKAAMVNQIGLESSFSQNFSWRVLDENGNVATGVSVSANQPSSTAQVQVTSQARVGAYRVVATSEDYDGYSRSLWIYVGQEADDALELYVSPQGDDYASGCISAPLRTIEAAQNRVQSLKQTGISCTVILREGEYRINQSLLFDGDDSGASAEKPIIYQGCEGENAMLKGSVALDASAAHNVTDEAVEARLHPDAKGKILEIDLAAQGIAQTDIYDPSATPLNSMDLVDTGEYNSLYINGREQELAHWPNGREYANFERWEFDEYYGNYKNEVLSYDKAWTDADRPNYFLYRETDSEPTRWANAKNWWVNCFSRSDYACVRMTADRIDTENRSIYLKQKPLMVSGDGYFYSKRWQAWNLLEELDIPGEFYIDREQMKLYFYPPDSMEDYQLELSVCTKPLLKISEAKHICFKNLEFTQTRLHAVSMMNVDNVDFIGCRFYGISGIGILGSGLQYAKTQSGTTGTLAADWQRSKLDCSYRVDIRDCSFQRLGSSAISLYGGNVDTLTPSENVIANNLFYRTAQHHFWFAEALLLRGVGITAEQNEFAAIPSQCIRLAGNDHIIRKNEFYDVVQEVTDAGAIYCEKSEVGRGNRVENNYFHDFDVENSFDEDVLRKNHEIYRIAVYFDGFQQGCTLEGNIFYKLPLDFQSTGTSMTVDRYNTSVEVDRTHRFTKTIYDRDQYLNEDEATNGRHSIATAVEGASYDVEDTISTIYDKALYFEKYPQLKAWSEGTHPLRFTVAKDNFVVGTARVDKEREASARTKAYGDFDAPVMVSECDDFVNAAAQDFRLKAGSARAQTMPQLLNDNNFSDYSSIGAGQSQWMTLEKDFSLIAPKRAEGISSTEANNFVWQEAAGAVSYHLVIADNAALDKPLLDVKTEHCHYTLPAGTLMEGKQYFWSVSAISRSKNHSEEWENVGGVQSFITGMWVRDFKVTEQETGVRLTATVQTASNYENDSTVYAAFYDTQGRLIQTGLFTKKKEEALNINQIIEVDYSTIKRVCLYVWSGELKPQLSVSDYQCES